MTLCFWIRLGLNHLLCQFCVACKRIALSATSLCQLSLPAAVRRFVGNGRPALSPRRGAFTPRPLCSRFISVSLTGGILHTPEASSPTAVRHVHPALIQRESCVIYMNAPGVQSTKGSSVPIGFDRDTLETGFVTDGRRRRWDSSGGVGKCKNTNIPQSLRIC